MLDKNTLLTLNKNPGSINLHDLALAKNKSVRVNPKSKHDFIADRARTKNLKNMDDVFKKINELKRNGTLDLWAKKYGHTLGLKESTMLQYSNLLENSSLRNKIDSLIENAMMSGVGPFATMVSSPLKVKTKYAKSTLMKEDCTTQDVGAEVKCKKG